MAQRLRAVTLTALRGGLRSQGKGRGEVVPGLLAGLPCGLTTPHSVRLSPSTSAAVLPGALRLTTGASDAGAVSGPRGATSRQSPCRTGSTSEKADPGLHIRKSWANASARRRCSGPGPSSLATPVCHLPSPGRRGVLGSHSASCQAGYPQADCPSTAHALARRLLTPGAHRAAGSAPPARAARRPADTTRLKQEHASGRRTHPAGARVRQGRASDKVTHPLGTNSGHRKPRAEQRPAEHGSAWQRPASPAEPGKPRGARQAPRSPAGHGRPGGARQRPRRARRRITRCPADSAHRADRPRARRLHPPTEPYEPARPRRRQNGTPPADTGSRPPEGGPSGIRHARPTPRARLQRPRCPNVGLTR
ncbi:hypothetical protein SDIAM103S_03798 [Streptomyces diastaticus subsp. diastaticus]